MSGFSKPGQVNSGLPHADRYAADSACGGSFSILAVAQHEQTFIQKLLNMKYSFYLDCSRTLYSGSLCFRVVRLVSGLAVAGSATHSMTGALAPADYGWLLFAVILRFRRYSPEGSTLSFARSVSSF